MTEWISFEEQSPEIGQKVKILRKEDKEKKARQSLQELNPIDRSKP